VGRVLDDFESANVIHPVGRPVVGEFESVNFGGRFGGPVVDDFEFANVHGRLSGRVVDNFRFANVQGRLGRPVLNERAVGLIPNELRFVLFLGRLRFVDVVRSRDVARYLTGRAPREFTPESVGHA
jgi:hypothetical protein